MGSEHRPSPEFMDSDLEVANVLAQGNITMGHNMKVISPALNKASPNSSQSLKRSSTAPLPGVSPFRPPTVLSNTRRNNTATTTPTFTMTVHQVAGRGEVSHMREIIKEQDINKLDEFQLTPIMWAAAYDQIDMVKFLLENGADVKLNGELKETIIHLVANYGHKNMLTMLLRHNHDMINNQTTDGNTPLMYAVYQQQTQCVKVLLEHGANMLLENGRGQTAPLIAALLGYTDIQSIFDEYILKLLEPT